MSRLRVENKWHSWLIKFILNHLLILTIHFKTRQMVWLVGRLINLLTLSVPQKRQVGGTKQWGEGWNLLWAYAPTGNQAQYAVDQSFWSWGCKHSAMQQSNTLTCCGQMGWSFSLLSSAQLYKAKETWQSCSAFVWKIKHASNIYSVPPEDCYLV